MSPDPGTVIDVQGELELVAAIRGSESSEDVVSAALATDERVIARVTDGIYRQPGSALRELISNAYDADAKSVVIRTDPPRFERIVVEDDGHGMSPEALANLILHIGGSAKRQTRGSVLGVTSTADSSLSPGGRKLIGKIGIGLFSVSQLTHTFQIITKVKGDPFRTVATVALRQYSDDESTTDSEGNDRYEAGRVNVWRESASDVESQGTTIVLNGIRPQARDLLRSRDIWSAIEHNETLTEQEERQALNPPKYHIGRVSRSGEILERHRNELSHLPWTATDSAEASFSKLVDAVWAEVHGANPNPRLDSLFDNYLKMVWQLSLSIPTNYVDGHIFDMPVDDWTGAFLLSNRARGGAEKVATSTTQTLRDVLELREQEGQDTFSVLFDGLAIRRPIKFRGLPSTGHAIKKPIVFVGKCREEFSGAPKELSGGALDFEAYLFWSPKIAPTEHQGALVRIHGSSGTLFDPTFMRYQVAEQNRLRQITCEIFIREGLDSALNIDRESFNNAHPHAVFITKWLHSALRQLATTQKRIASEMRAANRTQGTQAVAGEIQSIALRAWLKEMDDPASEPPRVEIVSANQLLAPGQDRYVLSREVIAPAVGPRPTPRQQVLEEKLKAIVQVLASFGLLDSVSQSQRERMFRAIYEILEASDSP